MIYDKHRTEIIMFVTEALQKVINGVPKIEYDTITSDNVKLTIIPENQGNCFSVYVADSNDRREDKKGSYIVEKDPIITYLMNRTDTGTLVDTLSKNIYQLQMINRMTTYAVLSEVVGHLISLIDTGIHVKYRNILNGNVTEDLFDKDFTFNQFNATDPNMEDNLYAEFKELICDIHVIVEEIVLSEIVNDNGSSIRLRVNDTNSTIELSYEYSPGDTYSIYDRKSVNMVINSLHDQFNVNTLVGMISSVIKNGREVR